MSMDGLHGPDLGADNPVPHIAIATGLNPGSGSNSHTQVPDDGPAAPPVVGGGVVDVVVSL
jgi:hypothetical protein